MILFNLIIINNSMIEYKSSIITLKIQANGNQYILSQSFYDKYPPDNMKVNGNDKAPYYQYDFRERMDNTVKLTWNNPMSNFEDMFRGCATITEIDFSEFVISGVTTMKSMFFGCSKLSSLDLSKFANSNPSDITDMFLGCSNLEYINLKNFLITSSYGTENIFQDVPENVVICLDGNSDQLKQQIYNKKNCYTEDCSDNWKQNQKKQVNERVCFDTSNNVIIYRYEYERKYYESCTNGVPINTLQISYCKCANNDEKCLHCSNEPIIDNNNCIECNHNQGYYEKEDENNNEYKNCYKNPPGYYLDNEANLDKKCYYSCNKCIVKGDDISHKCLECNHIQGYYAIENENINGYKNCYQNNPTGYYLDNEANLYKKCYYSCKKCMVKGDDIIHNCLECSDGYYEKENDNTNVYKNCYQNLIGYYLDNEAHLYKKCYDSCQSCEIPGDNIIHNCLECSTDYPLKFPVYNVDSNELNYYNCYFCNYYYFFDENNNFLCTNATENQ